MGRPSGGGRAAGPAARKEHRADDAATLRAGGAGRRRTWNCLFRRRRNERNGEAVDGSGVMPGGRGLHRKMSAKEALRDEQAAASLMRNSSGGRKKRESAGEDSWLGEKKARYRYLWLHPSGVNRRIFDVILSILVMWTLYSVPLVVAYEFRVDPGSTLWILDLCVDVVFFCEIIANFRTGVLRDATSEPCYDACFVAQSYLRGWFWIDAISTIPGLVLATLADNDFDASTRRSFELVLYPCHAHS